MNRSASIARKEGAFAAKGEYTLFLDPDDSLEKDAAEILYRTAKETDVEILHFGTNIINRGLRKNKLNGIPLLRSLIPISYMEKKYLPVALIRRITVLNIWNKLIKTALCKKQWPIA